MKADSLPQLIYQYPILGKVDKKSSLVKFEIKSKLISQLVFNFDWKIPFSYQKRSGFYWGFSIASFQGTVLEGKVELLTEDLDTLIYLLEVSVVPEKLTIDSMKHLVSLIKQFKNDNLFTIWWVGLAKNKNKKNQKSSILKEVIKLPSYQKEDDIDFGIIEEPSLEESLEGLGFDKDTPKEEIVVKLKSNVRELQKKFHPDIYGDDKKFKQIQEFKNIVESWILEEN